MKREKLDIPNLFENKKDCCACGACLNICPKEAISLKQDEYGFLYPEIDEYLCIRCELCKKVCAFQNVEEDNVPISTFAAISKNRNQAKNSASGGIFAAIAQYVINNNGIVYGAAFDDSWNVKHIGIEHIEDLIKLQGSKYTQSNTDTTFIEVKKMLALGKQVLYSGTPCQIAGLKKYLGKDYTNLITIDIICHGVPSNKMFKDYLSYLEAKNNAKIQNFKFRDKKTGWGINGSVVFLKQNKKVA